MIDRLKDWWKYVCIIYMFLFFVLIFWDCKSVGVTFRRWEGDDFTLPIASILNEHDFGISQDDIEFYKKLFPNTTIVDNYSLSGYVDRSGQELAYYFPTYAFLCIPYTLLFSFVGLPTEYVFVITNMSVLALFLCIIIKNYGFKKSFNTILVCSIAPVSLAMVAQSAEVVLFSLIGMALIYWEKKKYIRAALLISIAGTINQTALAVGIIMIVDYLYYVVKSDVSDKFFLIKLLFSWKKILIYGSCYLIALVPFCYFYYETGDFILTGVDNSKMTVGDIFSYFKAYIVDWNYGFIAYYALFLLLLIILAVVSIYQKKFNYLKYFIAFIVTIMAYCLKTHINCGMTGISRYNSWSSVILIMGIFFAEDNLCLDRIKQVIAIFTYSTVAWLIILFSKGYNMNMQYLQMTPVAAKILKYAPQVYNPLYSTFNSRVNHIDGGYNYYNYMPIIYEDSEGYVRKILADSSCVDKLKESLYGGDDDIEFVNDRIEALDSEPTYIDIPHNCLLRIGYLYQINGSQMTFFGEKANVSNYLEYGFSQTEDNFTWIDGNEAKLSFVISDSDSEAMRATIHIAQSYYKDQNLLIVCNGECVWSGIISKDNNTDIEFEFKNNVKEINELILLCPDAVSPSTVTDSADKRVLGVAICSMSIDEK